jgi:hypothetical protein
MEFHPADGDTVVRVLSSAIGVLKNACDPAKNSKDRELKEAIGGGLNSDLDFGRRELRIKGEARQAIARESAL